jgi:outer membrane protein OmpA-like peptidoglycan-associated protein
MKLPRSIETGVLGEEGRMKFQHACALGLALSVIGWAGAQAQDMMNEPGGYYLRLEGGLNHIKGLDSSSSASGFAFSSKENNGFIAGGAVGYKFGPFRLELDLDYRDNGVKSINVTNGGGFGAGLTGASSSPSGRVTSLTELINGIYDLPWRPAGLSPYVGLGIGATALKLSGFHVAGTNLVGDDDIVFAVQPSIGVRYPLNDAASIGLEYRFLNGFNPTFKDRTGAKLSTGDYQSHSILVNFTYAFGVAPPPPPPMAEPAAAPPPPAAAAPAQRQLFLVFFDFDRATITSAGKQVVDAAAQSFKGGGKARMELTGYTDLAGTQKYNLELSRRRAMAVRDQLVRDGVPRDQIGVAWKGKEDPRVPTPDGVREPQNRRVEIVMP